MKSSYPNEANSEEAAEGETKPNDRLILNFKLWLVVSVTYHVTKDDAVTPRDVGSFSILPAISVLDTEDGARTGLRCG